MNKCKFILGKEGFCKKVAIYAIQAPAFSIDGTFCAEHARRYDVLVDKGLIKRELI